jgi:hypothetical protein
MNMYEKTSFKKFNRIPFKKVLEIMGILYLTSESKLQCNGFNIDLEKNIFHTDNDCGTVIDFIKWKRNCSPDEAAEFLEGIFFTTGPTGETKLKNFDSFNPTLYRDKEDSLSDY